jgi:hypothetical protein
MRVQYPAWARPLSQEAGDTATNPKLPDAVLSCRSQWQYQTHAYPLGEADTPATLTMAWMPDTQWVNNSEAFNQASWQFGPAEVPVLPMDWLVLYPTFPYPKRLREGWFSREIEPVPEVISPAIVVTIVGASFTIVNHPMGY